MNASPGLLTSSALLSPPRIPSNTPLIDFEQETTLRGELKEAYEASLKMSHKKQMADNDAALLKASQLHHVDLFKTQTIYQQHIRKDANILLLINYPEFTSTQSCRFSFFMPGRVCLSLEQLKSTGSELLIGLLANEKHQRRAKKAAGPLGQGITHVIDLSPSTDEEDFTIALQRLSVTDGIKLWYRSMCFGVSPLAVAGHDDVCTCNQAIGEPYLRPQPLRKEGQKRADITGDDDEVCIFDTKEWPIEDHYNIDDFCQTRWAACTQRLFRSISQPAGQKDLLIDSAPRMWTMVGLFSKLEMTNYDLLRDEVAAWFNADRNYLFVELCPEETLRIGLTLKIPLISEPAFRILANERALEVAGGRPRSQNLRTIFGRRCSEFTDDTESISRIIDHAGTAMADRYKTAVDMLFSEDLLDRLNIPEWERLRSLDKIIPEAPSTGFPSLVRTHYDKLMSKIRGVVHQGIGQTYSHEGADLWAVMKNNSDYDLLGASWQSKNNDCLTTEKMDAMRAFTVPRREVDGNQSFICVWERLNQYQRALCPLFWQCIRDIKRAELTRQFSNGGDVASDFWFSHAMAQRKGTLPDSSDFGLSLDMTKYFEDLFQHVEDGLRAWATPLVNRDSNDFNHTVTPHLLLTLDDNEINFLRLAGDETRFEANVPEATMGPTGPGPAFHTGQSVLSVSDLDFESLAVVSNDGASTVVGSDVAQDGFSTVYDRHRVLARSSGPSVASEQFTDTGVSTDCAEAQHAAPAEYHNSGQGPPHISEQGANDDSQDDSDSMSDMLDEDDEGNDGVHLDEDDSDYEVISRPGSP